MKNRKMMSAVLSVVLATGMMFPAMPANAEDIVETIPHWFGCGYQHYDGMVYDITASEGTVTVLGRCEIPYTPEMLEGDYIKFGTVEYRTDEADLYFVAGVPRSGSFWVDETVNGNVRTATIWCKHGKDGLVAGEVFYFTIIGADTEKDYTVKVFDSTYVVPHCVDGQYAGSGYEDDEIVLENPELPEMIPDTPDIPPVPDIPAETQETTVQTTIPVTTATTTTTIATTETIPVETIIQTVIVNVPVHEAEYVAVVQTEPKPETVTPETTATETVSATETVTEEEEKEGLSLFSVGNML